MSLFKIMDVLISLCFLTLFLNRSQSATFTGDTFTADSNAKFANHTLQCSNNSDCLIQCEDYPNSCQHSIIQCPENGNCVIECTSGPSNNVCQDISVICPTQGNCSMSCSDDSACKDAHINGETSDLFSVSCNGDNTCANAMIDGRNTHSFELYCGVGNLNTCTSLTLFFPPIINRQKRAKLHAGDQCSAGEGNPMKFYARNGWIDVDIINYIGTYEHQIGTMYCGHLYDKSCEFDPNAWQCERETNVCNNPYSVVIEAQTKAATLSTTIYTHQKSSVFTNQLLYGVIGVLLGLLCCLFGICLYYFAQTYFQKKYDQTLKGSDSSICPQTETDPNLSNSALPPHRTKFMALNSGSSVSGFSTNEQSSTNKPIAMRAYRSYSNRSQSGNGTHEMEMQMQMQSRTQQSIDTINEGGMVYIAKDVRVVGLENLDSNTPQPSGMSDEIKSNDHTPIPGSPPFTSYSNTHSTHSTPVINTVNTPPIQLYTHAAKRFPYSSANNPSQITYQHSTEAPVQAQIHAQIEDSDTMSIINGINVQQSIPSTTQTATQTSENDNGIRIVYQPPPPHEMILMNSMMNQSAPPSLSKIITQNPILPELDIGNIDVSNHKRYSVSVTGFTNTGNKSPTKTQTPTKSRKQSVTMTISTRLQSLCENDTVSDESDCAIETHTNNDSTNIISELTTAMQSLVDSNDTSMSKGTEKESSININV